MAAVSDLAHAAGATVVVDNVFGTPVFQTPGVRGRCRRVLRHEAHRRPGPHTGRSGPGLEEFIDGPVKNLMRHTGPAMSPFNAWVLVKGLEDHVAARREAGCLGPRRRTGARGPPRVRRVVYPWLASHPQHDLARKQMLGGGTVVTFEVDGGKDEAFAVMNALRIVDISNNLGDAKSMVTHPATTTHRRLSPEARAAVGITDGTVRISVGLEDSLDLIDDLIAALG